VTQYFDLTLQRIESGLSAMSILAVFSSETLNV
jgi:hypothetical protein